MFTLLLLPHPVSTAAMADHRSRRADETDICVTHAENAGSLICTDESESHADDATDVNCKEVLVEKSFAPSAIPEKYNTLSPVVEKLGLLNGAIEAE